MLRLPIFRQNSIASFLVFSLGMKLWRKSYYLKDGHCQRKKLKLPARSV